MKIRILGGGWYGCHIASSLLQANHEVHLHESTSDLFHGASGNNPARLHLGWHYPRSRLTRAACQEHTEEFMTVYGHLTRAVATNVYAVARLHSLVDFGTYLQCTGSELEHIRIRYPEEMGLHGVEGAVLTGERHIVIARARAHFRVELSAHVTYNVRPEDFSEKDFDATIDATFCALDAQNVDRYEPCLVLLLESRDPRNSLAVTIMDGPFPSFYPWSERFVSLSSARYTPFSKECKTYEEAQAMLTALTPWDVDRRAGHMIAQMQFYYPEFTKRFAYSRAMLSVRAMPLSAADTRLVDIVQTGKSTWRVRPGKIDAVFHAAREIERLLEEAG